MYVADTAKNAYQIRNGSAFLKIQDPLQKLFNIKHYSSDFKYGYI